MHGVEWDICMSSISVVIKFSFLIGNIKLSQGDTGIDDYKYF